MQLHSGRPLQVFLSHASQDIHVVRVLYQALKSDGLAAWLAEEDLDPGTRWQIKISEVVRNSDVVLVCLSEGSVNKEGYFQREITMALDVAAEKPEGTIFLIPVRLDKCEIPDRLKIFQWVDLFDGTSIDRHYYLRLMRSLTNRARDVGANLFLEGKEAIQGITSPESIQEFSFNPVTLDFLRLKQEHRIAMEVSALVRLIDTSILQHVLLSYDEMFQSWSREDFAALIRDWETRGFLKWENGFVLATEMRSLIRSYLDKDRLTAAKIHASALIIFQTRLQAAPDDRKRLIIEELYHLAALVRLTGTYVDLPKILAQRLEQYPPFIRTSGEGWRNTLEQLQEAIEFDSDLRELISNEMVARLLREIDNCMGSSPHDEADYDDKISPESADKTTQGGRQMKLGGKQFEQLMNALLSAFRTAEELARMTSIRLEVNLHEIGYGDLRNYSFKLIEWAQANGRLADLVLGARQSNPGNLDLLAVAQELGLAIGNVPPNRKLQRIIRENNSFLDINSWRTMLAKIEYQVCRVEFKLNTHEHIYGTGFLIGKDVVMTNYHVMKYVIEKEQRRAEGRNWAEAGKVILRFDLKVIDNDNTVSEGTKYRLDPEEWLVDASPTSLHDEGVEPGGVPDEDQLDYALLRLDGSPGDEAIGKSEPGAPKRGWIKIHREPYDFSPDSALMIVQHPSAGPLKLAIETQALIGLNENGTRVTYRTNTEPGSSGSPCFNINWELVALHHAGDPNFSIGHQPEYNQGVPFHAIYELIKKHNLLEEIQN